FDVEPCGRGLRQVAHSHDVAVRHVPDATLTVANAGAAQCDALDHSTRVVEIDLVTDAELVVDEHEEAGDDIAHHRLRTERQRATDDGGGGDERSDVD